MYYFITYNEYCCPTSDLHSLLRVIEDHIYGYLADSVFNFDLDNIDYDELIRRLHCFAFHRNEKDGTIEPVEINYRKHIDQCFHDLKESEKQHQFEKAKRKFFYEVDKDFTNGTFNPELYLQKWKDEIQPLKREL